MRHEMGDALFELCNSTDFFATSPCRDLIFHFKEHRYTLPQLEQALSDLNLGFIGFEFIDNTWAPATYRQQCPQDKDMTNLTLWDQFESQHPYTFSKLYDFWCQLRA